jgi:transmembrane sensor
MELKTIEKYLNGTASPVEKKQVLDFFKHEDLVPENEDMLRIWWDQYENDIKGPSDKVLVNIHEIIKIKENDKYAHLKWLGIAVSMILLFSISYLLSTNNPSTDFQDLEMPQMVTKQTPSGVKLRFELPDGSMVNLNSNSSLMFPEKFVNERNVVLEGEAYFEVAKKADQIFKVECFGLSTTVLGTSFNISSFEEVVVVSVTSGKVIIDFNDVNAQPVHLISGEQVKWDKLSGDTRVNQFNIYEATAWKEGVLIFDDCGLCDIIKTLERWYGVEINVEDKRDICSLDWSYTGQFKNESLKNVLYGIAYVKGFYFEIKDKKVWIKLLP